MPKPTIGRRVWFWPFTNGASSGFTYHDARQPLDAGIAYVHSDTMINISVADQNGVMHSRTSVPLLAEGDQRPEYGGFCEWMPYQLNAAKKDADTA